MNATLEFILVLSVFIFAAKAGGLISTRFGQPAVLGQLLVGVVLGPTVLDVFSHSSFGIELQPYILDLGEIGVIFLMFMAGLEIDLDEMFESGRVALLAGSLGVIFPLILGALVGLAFHLSIAHSIFVGLILTATSVSISAQTLLEMGVLNSREGMALLGAAVVDDVLGILLLSIFLGLAQSESSSALSILIVLARMLFYFAVSIGFGILVLPTLTRWVSRLPISEGVISLVVVTTLLYAWSAEVVGAIAAITGAFIAGALFARTTFRSTIRRGMHTLTYAIFVPLFLISVGLRANARALGGDSMILAAAVILVAIVGKVAGAWLGARLGGFEKGESFRVGVGMISRGEVGLIIAAIGLGGAWISQDIYSIMIVMVLVTTMVTPVLLRLVFPRADAQRPAESVPSTVVASDVPQRRVSDAHPEL